MQAHLENIPAHPVVYIRRVGPYGEQNYKLMQEMKAWVQSRDLWRENGVIYGIAWDNAAETPPDECRYDVCFVTDRTFEEKGIRHGRLPAGAYLVYEVVHTVDGVRHFYSDLDNALASAERRIDQSRPILERYPFSLVEKGYCAFCVPVLGVSPAKHE